jgi:hypothetical protein
MAVVAGGLTLTVGQVIVNYRFFAKGWKYANYRFRKWRENNAITNENEESQSNLAEHLDADK